MAKRFFDSRKYQDPWFRKLEPKYKLFWDYLLSTCDHTGIWKKDFEMASFCISAGEYEEKACFEVFKDRIIEIPKEKWFIPKFILFQYGDVEHSEGRVIKAIYTYLKEQDLLKYLTLYKHSSEQSVNTLSNTPKDKDKDDDDDKRDTAHDEYERRCHVLEHLEQEFAFHPNDYYPVTRSGRQ